MKKLKIMLLSLLFVVSATSYAGNEASVTAFNNLLSGITTFTADFTQTQSNKKGQTTQQSYGHLALSRPGKFRWDVTKPIPQLIVANQNRVWVYDSDLDQVTIRRINAAEGNAPALLLSHDKSISSKDYDISDVTKSADMQWFKLVPKNKDNLFAYVEMGFANAQIKEMVLKDHLGQTTRVVYKNIKTNVNLPEKLFSFKPPAHVDVIDETKK